MVYEIISICLGRISSPTNPLNKQGPFFHCSCDQDVPFFQQFENSPPPELPPPDHPVRGSWWLGRWLTGSFCGKYIEEAMELDGHWLMHILSSECHRTQRDFMLNNWIHSNVINIRNRWEEKNTLRITITLPNKTGIQEKIQKPFYRVIKWMVIMRDFPYDVWIGVIFHDPCSSPEQRFIKDSFPEISAHRPVVKDDIWCWFHSSIFHFHPLKKMIPTHLDEHIFQVGWFNHHVEEFCFTFLPFCRREISVKIRFKAAPESALRPRQLEDEMMMCLL